MRWCEYTIVPASAVMTTLPPMLPAPAASLGAISRHQRPRARRRRSGRSGSAPGRAGRTATCRPRPSAGAGPRTGSRAAESPRRRPAAGGRTGGAASLPPDSTVITALPSGVTVLRTRRGPPASRAQRAGWRGRARTGAPASSARWPRSGAAPVGQPRRPSGSARSAGGGSSSPGRPGGEDGHRGSPSSGSEITDAAVGGERGRAPLAEAHGQRAVGGPDVHRVREPAALAALVEEQRLAVARRGRPAPRSRTTRGPRRTRRRAGRASPCDGCCARAAACRRRDVVEDEAAGRLLDQAPLAGQVHGVERGVGARPRRR